jgi:HEAT repeat protein
MFTKPLISISAAFLLYVSLANISITKVTAPVKSPETRHLDMSPEKRLLVLLGLKEDVNDTQIIQLLDVPKKQIFATGLVRYRRISSATPKLLQIVNDANIFFPPRLTAADALCDFGNKEWIPAIKALSLDPNSIVARSPFKIEVARLLARAGDYSQFEVVAKSVGDNKSSVRHLAIQALGEFCHKNDPVTDSATKLLYTVATSDDVPSLRDQAIVSLEKIAKIKPEVTSKVIDAIQANVNSADKNLRTMCRQKLKVYSKQSKTN